MVEDWDSGIVRIWAACRGRRPSLAVTTPVCLGVFHDARANDSSSTALAPRPPANFPMKLSRPNTSAGPDDCRYVLFSLITYSMARKLG